MKLEQITRKIATECMPVGTIVECMSDYFKGDPWGPKKGETLKILKTCYKKDLHWIYSVSDFGFDPRNFRAFKK